MRRYALFRAALWIASLIGAVLVAAAIATPAKPGALNGVGAFAAAYWTSLLQAPTLDFGTSDVLGGGSADVATLALLRSLDILLPALPIAILFGVALAAALAWRWTYFLTAPLTRIAGSVPVFCVALSLAALFPGPAAPANPDSLFAAIRAGEAGNLLNRLAPLIWIVGLAGAGAIGLAVSKSLEAVLKEPYGGGLMRHGLSQSEIVRVYLVRHATALSLREAGDILLVFYAVLAVVEWVFAWPGAGTVFIRSVALADWSVVASFVLVLAGVRFTADFLCSLGSRALLGRDGAR
jgi:peptide/nickel transport system permease protein